MVGGPVANSARCSGRRCFASGLTTAWNSSSHTSTAATGSTDTPKSLPEARLRKCLAVLDQEAVKAVQKRKTGKIADLTFGEYKYLINNKVNWKRIGRSGVPRDQFVHRLDKVRVIRNEIAHFRPQPLTAGNLATLEEFAGLLRQYVP